MNILGLNAYHGDSSACLLRDGKLIAAVEEERFRRIKHWAGFPTESIRYCLQEAKMMLSDLDIVAINRNPQANLFKKAMYVLTKKPAWKLIQDRFKFTHTWLSAPRQLQQLFPYEPLRARFEGVEHHRAHMASGYLVSPFEEATVVSVDGFGDFASAGWGMGRGTDIQMDGEVHFPHSLGIFYQAMTQFLGFPNYGDEYKVMGLAPYGEPRYLSMMREIVLLQKNGTYQLNLRYFRHHEEFLNYTWHEGSPSVDALYSSELENLLGPARKTDVAVTQRDKDIACSVQMMYEEAFFHLLNTLHKRYQTVAVTLAGGCAMNSVANGKIYQRTPFKQAYIQSAAGDAGGALGSAFSVHHDSASSPYRFRMTDAYWGPRFSDDELTAVIEKVKVQLTGHRCTVDYVGNESMLYRRTAQAIADEKVVGWFQGRMEWGPRSLGNRSILGDPRSPHMKELLNRKIKRRESFRPFAPSILREKVSEWFETDDDVPFMMKVFQIREEKRALVPAVTHVDGSGRLQTVERVANERYYRLICAFENLTGVPMILNTSFNENEPVVCRPEEALDCFLRTEMDVLVLGSYYVSRGGTP